MRKTIKKKDTLLSPLLTETLPFELPPFFSNNQIYLKLEQMKPSIVSKRSNGNEKLYLRFTNVSIEGRIFLNILFGTDIAKFTSLGNGGPKLLGTIDLNVDKIMSESYTPFSYKIRKNSESYRVLSIPHYGSQIQVSIFYYLFKYSIIESCSKSRFSLRKPTSIASHIKLRVHNWKRDEEIYNFKSISENENDLQRTYFNYSDYEIISRYYDSGKYAKNNRQFNYMLKTDIQNCFASVYTHSISWSIHGKQVTKQNIIKTGYSFAGAFDKLLQRMNDNETHGIIIGSELSRLFYEILMQKIDTSCEKIISEKNLIFGEDYVINRYMDDYFIFANRIEDLNLIRDILSDSLYQYRFMLNEAKSQVTNTNAASSLKYFTEPFNDIVKSSYPPTLDGERRFSRSEKLCSSYNQLLSENDMDTSVISNAALTILERELDRFINICHAYNETLNTKDTDYICERLKSYVQVCFHLYNSYRAETTAVKLLRVISTAEKFLRDTCDDKNTNYHFRNFYYKMILNQVNFDIKKDTSGVHTIYLISGLAKSPSADKHTNLSTIFNFYEYTKTRNIKSPIIYSVFLKVLISMEDPTETNDYIQLILSDIFNLLKELLNSGLDLSSTEVQILALEYLSCPAVSQTNRKRLINKLKVNNFMQGRNQNSLFREPGTLQGPTDWMSTDLHVELLKKRFIEVY